MEEQKIENMIKTRLSELLEEKVENITEDIDLQELGFSSFTALELISILEKDFEIELIDISEGGFTTLKGITQSVRVALEKRI